MDADTKLMVAWRLGARDASYVHAFIRDIQERLANRVQLTTDGNRLYMDAVLDDFAMKNRTRMLECSKNDCQWKVNLQRAPIQVQ